MHQRVGPAFPPLIESGCACRRCCSTENRVKESAVINRRLRSEIKPHCRRKQDKQRQSRFDELSEVTNEAATRRKSWIFKRCRLHARTGWLRGAPGGRALPISNCEIRQQVALILTPK